MTKKIIQIFFITLFLLILAFPLLKTDFNKDVVSKEENRILANFPELYNEGGKINKEFNSEFETWFDDHVGFRSNFVLANAVIQYELFGKLTEYSDYAIGRDRELFFIGEYVMKNYQHSYQYTEDELNEIAYGYQLIDDYLFEHNIQFYYVQNWDKQSIYPEKFIKGVNIVAEKSLTEQVMEVLAQKTSVNVVSMKPVMLKGKEICRTYNKWADVTHWSYRGAFMGYQYLMGVLNENNDNSLKVLEEEEFSIKTKDMSPYIMGGIHEKDYVEVFEILNPKAEMNNKLLTLHADAEKRQCAFINDECDNDLTVLVLGDSYFRNFLIGCLAESFNRTIMLWSFNIKDIVGVVEEYKPDIVIYEKAEREPSFLNDMRGAVKNINNYLTNNES